jgi:hypothetical protein
MGMVFKINCAGFSAYCFDSTVVLFEVTSMNLPHFCAIERGFKDSRVLQLKHESIFGINSAQTFWFFNLFTSFIHFLLSSLDVAVVVVAADFALDRTLERVGPNVFAVTRFLTFSVTFLALAYNGAQIDKSSELFQNFHLSPLP